MPNENEDFQHRELLFKRELSDLKLAYVQLKDNLDRQNEKLDRLTKEGLIDIETLRKFCEIAELTATTANQAAEVIGNYFYFATKVSTITHKIYLSFHTLIEHRINSIPNLR